MGLGFLVIWITSRIYFDVACIVLPQARKFTQAFFGKGGAGPPIFPECGGNAWSRAALLAVSANCP